MRDTQNPLPVWKRRYANVRAGTQAPPLRFRLGGSRVGRLISFVWDAWKDMMEMGRGGACVPARVALQGRIHRLFPRAQCVYFWYGNAATRTFGRAHRRRPNVFRLDGLRVAVDTVWGGLRVEWVISFGVDCVWVVLFVGKTVHMNQHHRCCTFVSPGLIERSEIYPG